MSSLVKYVMSHKGYRIYQFNDGGSEIYYYLQTPEDFTMFL